MTNDKYSLIIMRDSTQKVRRFRIGAQKLKLLLYLLFIFVALTIAGIIFSVHSIKKYATLNNEISLLQANLAEANIKLESLHNVQEILKDSEKASRTQSPMDTGPKNDPAQSEEPEPTSASLNATQVVANVFPNAVTNAQNGTAPSSQNATPAVPPNMEPNNTPANNQTKQELSPARISKVVIRARSPKTISVGFDLHNTTQGKTLSGDAALALVTKTGEVLEIVVPKTHMDFQINYYKRMVTTFPLPTGLTPKDISALQIKIIANGTRYPAESFPFPQPNGQ